MMQFFAGDLNIDLKFQTYWNFLDFVVHSKVKV
jgi:hypothetical protein